MNTLEKACRAIGSKAAARGTPVTFAMNAAADDQQREWIRQGHDTYMARFGDRRAA